MSLLDLTKDSPLRPPDWRWERAKLTRSDPRLASRLRRDEDAYTHRARLFQAALERCRDDCDLLDLTRAWPHLLEAKRVREGEKRLVRWELEARLLADEAPAAFAGRINVSAEAVRWYEALFFNVGDRLHCRGYITNVILGEKLHHGLTERDLEVIWKCYGYAAGPVVLDVVIDTFRGLTRVAPGQDMVYLADDARWTNTLKTAISARTQAVNGYTQPLIAENFHKFQEAALKAGAGGDSAGQANLRAFLEGLAFTVGGSRRRLSPKDPEAVVGFLPDQLADADADAAEASAADLVRFGTGEKLPRRIATFPEPEQRTRVTHTEAP